MRLNLVSGALVVVVGAAVLRSRVRARRHHHHHHHHHAPESFSWRSLVALGAAAGIIPCPSALVVLLGAVAQGEIALGMVLIVAFSLGLAATLTFLGLDVVYAGKAVSRLPVPGPGPAVAAPASDAPGEADPNAWLDDGSPGRDERALRPKPPLPLR